MEETTTCRQRWLLLLIVVFLVYPCDSESYPFKHVYLCKSSRCREFAHAQKFLVSNPHKHEHYSKRYRPVLKQQVKPSDSVHHKITTPTLPSRQERCDGYENFIHDIEIASLVMTTVSYFKALLSLVLHIVNQAYGFVSVHLIGTPERLSWLIEQIREGIIDDNLHLMIEWLGFFDYLVTRWASFPLGNIIIVLGVVAHVIGGIALGIDWIVPFKDVFRNTVLDVTGIDLEVQLAGYGCHANEVDHRISRVFQEVVRVMLS